MKKNVFVPVLSFLAALMLLTSCSTTRQHQEIQKALLDISSEQKATREFLLEFQRKMEADLESIKTKLNIGCQSYHGYGRYMIRVDCDDVEIEGKTYKITRRGNELVVAGHTLPRGIYRKTRPWLYLHHVSRDKVDITFEEGSKPSYPLYTGVSESIFDPYVRPWPVIHSTNVEFPDNYWLVSHRWSDRGIFFDLHQQLGDVTRWRLVRGDIFVPGDGTEISIEEISTKVKVLSFDPRGKKARVQFVAQ